MEVSKKGIFKTNQFMKKEKENNMNRQEMDILKCLYEKKYVNQRVLAEQTGHSLGIVNRYVNELQDAGYITDQMTCTNKSMEEFEIRKPQNAIILAAGFGMRMVPINTEIPKGLLEINGEPLIERMIRQLHEVGISKIYVIVGFMKERYEYLIDKFKVELVVNSEYSTKNNLYSMEKVLPFLSHGGAGIENIEKDLHALCPSATICEAFMIQGQTDEETEADLNVWLYANASDCIE